MSEQREADCYPLSHYPEGYDPRTGSYDPVHFGDDDEDDYTLTCPFCGGDGREDHGSECGACVGSGCLNWA